jgi:hypothetical protein
VAVADAVADAHSFTDATGHPDARTDGHACANSHADGFTDARPD